MKTTVIDTDTCAAKPKRMLLFSMVATSGVAGLSWELL